MNPAMAAWAKKAASSDSGWPKDKLSKAKKLAERMKGKKEIENPHALARWTTARNKTKAGKEG